MGRYVGIDPSTKTGIVILDRDGRLIDAEEITAKGTDPGRMLDIIDNTVEQLEPNDIVAIEGFAYGAKGNAVSTQYGIGWGMRMALFSRGIRYDDVAPAALKKFVGAKGNAKKDELAVHIYKRWGYEHPSDNVRDAFVLAQIARAVDYTRRGVSVDLTAYQEAVVRSIISPPSKRKRGA
jgi:crossover junction endodeoxyribonuclease RuvC